MSNLSSANDKPLFTPGPLTTSRTVKQAMLRDLGSRDGEFLRVVREIRAQLLQVAGLGDDYTAGLMQGSGTFSVEAVIGSTIPPQGKVLILANGAYGKRMVAMARALRIEHTVIEYPEHCSTSAQDAANALARDPALTHVAMVHSETTSGLVNDIAAVGAHVKTFGKKFIVDAMSSFGGIETDWRAVGADYIVSSANKCIEGVPGFGFILARRSALVETEGWARSLAMDLFAQIKGLEGDGQFRFTPPTHALLAFYQALDELTREGGVRARAARYRANYQTLVAGTRALGLREYLDPRLQGHIIVSFLYPDDPRFDFKTFYERLNERGYVIYPGKVGSANCFRIGCIGRLFPADVQNLVNAMRVTLDEMLT
ncbi:MAG: 2-aminoethylphosphonate--pyruvate transaminase [Anaerolineae bacterium]|nr:2-aminoethylphosphonate--pyruvate transaminase [Anaerolineae bacterium]